MESNLKEESKTNFSFLSISQIYYRYPKKYVFPSITTGNNMIVGTRIFHSRSSCQNIILHYLSSYINYFLFSGLIPDLFLAFLYYPFMDYN